MFEFIGLFFATAIFFALASIASTVLAAIIWLLMRKHPNAPRKSLIAAALLIPLCSAAYMWICVAALPGESVFGDISEPLPNGYVVDALGKMPDYANIHDPKSPRRGPGLFGYIGELALDGQLVVGKYSHFWNTSSSKEHQPFFVFDTQSGSVTEYPTIDAVESKLGHPVTLQEVQFFRSPLAQTRRQADNAIMFGPPFIALLALSAFVWRCMTRIDTAPRNIYT